MGILHETGHALGLKHGHEFPLALSADRDSTEYSVMTYRSFPGDDAEGYNNETWGYPQTLMMYDIAGLQSMYGANYGFNAGNSVYTWSATTGEMSINGAGQGAPGNGIGGSANRVFLTIWDGGGTDTYDMSNYSAGLTIDLRPGEWSTLDPIQLAHLGSGHYARGNVANALLFQGNAASLIENAIGGAGNDLISANQAANQLTGNGGIDNFRWASATDAGTGALADTITDFLRGTDKINLSDVDAIAGTPANDAFTFIGTGAFTGTAGQLRYEVNGGHAHVLMDTDGNGAADMQIIVNNVTTLAGSDFVF
jgi:serralysin